MEVSLTADDQWLVPLTTRFIELKMRPVQDWSLMAGLTLDKSTVSFVRNPLALLPDSLSLGHDDAQMHHVHGPIHTII